MKGRHGSLPLGPLCFALTVLSASGAFAGELTFNSSLTAIIQPAGPRQGANGLAFFNVEGSSNGTFASFAVADFSTTATTAKVGSSLSLVLSQDNAFFTHNGALAFYLTQDTTTSIGQTTSPLKYMTSDLPTGLGSQLTPNNLLGTGTFTQVVNGHQDIFTFSLTGAERTYLDGQLASGSTIRLIVAPNDATVAATYAGSTNTTVAVPQLRLTTTPEPSSSVLAVVGAAVMGTVAHLRRRRRETATA